MFGNTTQNASSIAEHLEEKNPDAATRRIPTTYKCRDCNKEYSSFQALGGHRASHKKLKTETGAHSSPGPWSLEQTPSTKLHECRICNKGFAIGQALGGHMRKHRGEKFDNEEKGYLSKTNKEIVNGKIWNATALSSRLDSSSSVMSNYGKEVFKYDLNLLPHENEWINIYRDSITKRKFS